MNSADSTPEPQDQPSGGTQPLDGPVPGGPVLDGPVPDAPVVDPAAPGVARVPPVAASPRALPQPGLIIAVALTTVPLVTQVILGSLIMMVAALAYVLVTARPHEVLRFSEEIQVFLLPVGTFITLLVAIGVCWLFFGRAMGRRIAWRGLSSGQLLCVIAMTLPLAVLASEVTNCVAALMEHFELSLLNGLRESGSELFGQFVSLPVWLVFLGGCLLPGLGEEIYCRGLLSRGLVARYGVVVGTFFAAGLFGAMHIEPVQAVGAFALGIGLQFVFLTTRSLLAPIVLHTLNNSFAFLTMRFAGDFPIPGLTPMADGSAVHTPMMVMVTAVLAAAALMAILFQNRTRWQLPDGSDWHPGYVTAEIPDAAVGAVAVRDAVNPLLILGAAVGLALHVGAIVVAHLSVVDG